MDSVADGQTGSRLNGASQITLPVDADAFAAEIEPFRRELQVHCYRMLGNVYEAEDLAQDALMQAWHKRDTFEARGTLRAWLYKIATNACLNALQRKPRRSLPLARGTATPVDAPIPAAQREPIWLEPFPDDLLADDAAGPEAAYDAHESITLAFMTALHTLPPRQRAVLILSDVLDWPARDIATLLDTTVLAVKSALRRARVTLEASYAFAPAISRDIDDASRDALMRYVRGWESADIDGLIALLRSDATFSMPPIPAWYRSPSAIRWLISGTVFAGAPARRWRLVPTRASGRPAFGLYKLDDAGLQFIAYGIQVVSLIAGQVIDITTCVNPALAGSFGLPDVVEV
jgi:RNA polymerase sigma-70 factor, ECF subfamily